jgi:hypothetical protein
LRRAVAVVIAFAVVAIEGSIATATTTSEPSTGIVARLNLPSRTIRAGSHLNASITVINRTGRAVDVGGCNFLFQVGWTNKAVTANPNWELCAGSLTIPAGQSTWPVWVGAAYTLCSQDPPGTTWLPQCLPGNRQRPLPPGYYRLTVYGPSDAMRLPPPIKVHVIASAHR